MTASRTSVDPRGPRFGAAITATLLLVDLYLALVGAVPAAIVLTAVLTALFAWGAFAGIGRHPYGVLFRTAIRPRLRPPTEMEDPAPPTFAQGVGFVVALAGTVLGIAGVPAGLAVCVAVAFVAAFLNAAFAFCLGCHLYVLLLRARLLPRRSSTVEG